MPLPSQPRQYSPREQAALLDEVLDKDKVQLLCGEHSYVASQTPPQPSGCKNCWEAYYWYMIASTPPHLRQQRLGELERAVRNANQMYERGEFDFQPLDHAIISTEKDALDDSTGAYTTKDQKWREN